MGKQNPGISSGYTHVSISDKPSSFETEHARELADVESGVGML
jgi:hypothetical protein